MKVENPDLADSEFGSIAMAAATMNQQEGRLSNTVNSPVRVGGDHVLGRMNTLDIGLLNEKHATSRAKPYSPSRKR